VRPAAPASEHQWRGEQRQEEQRLGPGERRRPQRQAESSGRLYAGSLAGGEGGEHSQAHRQPVERLAHQQRVVGHQRRVDRGDCGGDHAEPLPAETPGRQAGDSDRSGSQGAADRLVGVVGRGAEKRRERQQGREERRMESGGQRSSGVAEQHAAALADR